MTLHDRCSRTIRAVRTRIRGGAVTAPNPTNEYNRHDERGATYVLFALLLLVVMGSAAVGVDLTARQRRGQDLQNVADAASLAAVTAWVDASPTPPPVSVRQQLARQRVNDVISMSGLNDVNAPTVSFPNGNEVRVEIVDDSPAVFFGSFVPTSGTISRNASAKLDTCGKNCKKIVEIPPPFTTVRAPGSGDGFIPIPVNNFDRFYAINHNEFEIVCVDGANPCWSARPAYPEGQSTNSDNIVHAAVVGTRIWYTGQTPTDFRLYCWETLTDTPCPTGQFLAPLPESGFDSGGGGLKHFRSRGGALASVADRLYAFTDDHRVHCYIPASGGDCGYGTGGRATGLATVLPPLDPSESVSGAGMDRVVGLDGKIYVSVPVIAGSDTTTFPPGTYVHCWDTNLGGPCIGFDSALAKIHDTGHPRFTGRLFFNRATNGGVVGLCSTAALPSQTEINCLDMSTGALDPAQTSTFVTLANAMGENRDGTVGIHTFHEPSGRLFLTAGHNVNSVFCWDFTATAMCSPKPEISLTLDGVDTETYGFVYKQNCLYGLGHENLFYTMDPDGNEGCVTGSRETAIDPCECADGSKQWGTVFFDGLNLSSTGPFEKFEVSVFAPGPNPSDRIPVPGFQQISMIDNPDGQFRLEGVPIDLPLIYVLVDLAAKPNEDPWENGILTLTVKWHDLAYLVE